MEKEKLKKPVNAADCPIRNVLDRVGDKWSILVIMMLGNHGTLRFNELNTHIGTISQKMLTVTLKTLEADGLITRTMYPQIPPRVEYMLTDMGRSLLPAVGMLSDWATANMPAILAARTQYAQQTR